MDIKINHKTMKRTIITIVCLLLITSVFSQKKTITFYPDGKPYKGESNTIGQLKAEFEDQGRVYLFAPYTDQDDYLTSIAFKLFTDEPLWVLIEDSTQIPQAIKCFNLNEFFQSWKFDYELIHYIKEGTLSDIFIIQTLGQPDRKTKSFDENIQVDSWFYMDLGVTLKFRNGIVTGFIKIE